MLRIAVVIPLYNGARFIADAVASVLAQARPPSALIVVNDGSTDDGEGDRALARASDLAEFPVRLLHKPNGGQSSARNFGVAHTDADLIAFLDQDDIWHPEHLAKLTEPFETDTAGKLGWAYSNIDLIDETRTVTKRGHLDGRRTEHPKRTLTGCFAGDMSIYPSATVIRRAAFVSVGGFDERLIGHEDDDLFIRLLAAGYENIYLPESLASWRRHSHQATRDNRAIGRSRGIFARKSIAAFPEHRRAIVARYMSMTMAEACKPIAALDREWLGEITDDLAALGIRFGSVCFSTWQGAYAFRKLWRIVNRLRHAKA